MQNSKVAQHHRVLCENTMIVIYIQAALFHVMKVNGDHGCRDKTFS